VDFPIKDIPQDVLDEVCSQLKNYSVKASVHGRAFFSMVQESYHRNGYDFLDLSAKMDLPDVPSNFHGISGGGFGRLDYRWGSQGNSVGMEIDTFAVSSSDRQKSLVVEE
jgi:hypothetical protein